jgi:hypothetical protein
MPEFRSIEIRSGFVKAALARPFLRFRTRKIKRNSDLEIRSLLLLRHSLSTPPDHVAKLLKPTPQYANMPMRKSRSAKDGDFYQPTLWPSSLFTGPRTDHIGANAVCARWQGVDAGDKPFVVKNLPLTGSLPGDT